MNNYAVAYLASSCLIPQNLSTPSSLSGIPPVAYFFAMACGVFAAPAKPVPHNHHKNFVKKGWGGVGRVLVKVVC